MIIMNQNQQENRKQWAIQKKQDLRESRKKNNKALFTFYQGLDEATLEMVALAKISKET